MKRASVLMAVLCLVASPVWSGVKENQHQQMINLAQQMRQLRASGQVPSGAYTALSTQYNQISAALGGDDPAATVPDGAPAVDGRGREAPEGTIGTIPPPPAGCTETTSAFTNSTPVPIPTTTPPIVVSSTIIVAGAGPFLWDLNLQTFLTHTFSSDLDVTLLSPAGTIVTITTDNGGGNDNVYNGTAWDDDANPLGQVPYATNDGLVTDSAYVNNVVETPLVPEEAMAAFLGEDPNGTWTLTISDDANLDGGSLNSWTLELSTVPVFPTATVVPTATNSTPVVISPVGAVTVSSTIVVAGAGTYLLDLDLTTFITHTFNNDLKITLLSPAGTIVTVTSNNDGGSDNVYNGTVWDDDADPLGQVPYVNNDGLVNDSLYANLVVETPLVIDEAMGAFLGEDPNGTWTLTIRDDFNLDGGSLDSWSLDIDTGSCGVGPCVLTCPGNQSAPNDLGQCDAAVAFPPPGTSGSCGPVTCVPASGSTFPVGTTTVNCTEQIPAGQPEGLSNCCFDNGGLGCDDPTCEAAVCAADSFCCNVAWDQICADEAVNQFCVALCGGSNCCSAHGTPGCDDATCQASVCAIDSFCCNVAWDSICASEAQSICPICQGGGGGASCAFDVTVSDTEPPSIVAPPDQQVGTDAPACNAVANFAAPTVGDNCPGVGAPACVPPSGSTFALGLTAVACTVSDAAGNSANDGINITVVDDDAPSVTAPDLVVGTDPGLCSAVVAFIVTPTDNCPGVGAAVCVPPSGSTFPEGVNIVNCSVQDAAGNQASDPGSITVNDIEDPVISCPADIELDLPPYSTGQNVDYDPPVTSDNCGVDSVDCQPPSGDLFPAGTTPVNCIVYDPTGNSATCSFNVILNEVSVLEVPTMSKLGLAALALLLAGAALVAFRRHG